MPGPSRLYKYRPFNADTLDLLGNREVYYSTPSSFNDPLDCEPVVIANVDITQMELFLAHVSGWPLGSTATVGRFAEMKAWAGEELENEVPYPALSERRYRFALSYEITKWVKSTFDKQGIFCLAANWQSPLMWSHYADAHKGICVEFDNDDHACTDLRQVQYDLPRGIRLSDLIDWQMRENKQAEERVRAALLAVKAKAWDYEQEWRDVAKTSGPGHSPFTISGVYFGMRCPQHVKTTIISLMTDALPDVEFYNVFPGSESFKLERTRLDPGEEMLYRPYPSARRIFAQYAESPDAPSEPT